jgi:Predicted acyltransferases
MFLLFYNTLTLTQNIIIAPIELLLLQSFFDSLFNTLNNSGTWFMSCLFFCYLLFPLFKEILVQLKTKKILLFFILYFLTFLSPIIVKIYKTSSIYSNPFFRLLEFLMGMLVADFALKNITKIKKHAIACLILEALILFICVTILKRNAFFTNDYTMYNIISVPLFALLIYNVSKVKNKWILQISGSSLIQYLSKISFSFFFSQFFTFDITKHLITFSWFNNDTNIKMILTSLGINLLISILMYEIIEKPSKKILTNFIFANVEKNPTSL